MQNKKRKGDMDERTWYVAFGIITVLALMMGILIGSHMPQGTTMNMSGGTSSGTLGPNVTQIAEFNQARSEVMPQRGYILPAKWGTSIRQLVADGALNVTALALILNKSGQPLTAQEQQILAGTSTVNVTVNSSDSTFMLMVLWSLGINNNNTMIGNGPIMKFGGNPDNLASTGGYRPLGNLQLGKLNIIGLTQHEQAVANYTAFYSYRPCCDNPTMMPDCNHGAAALGLIELMASQGANETTVFTALKEFNSFEFPQEYTNLAMFLKGRGVDFSSVPGYVLVSKNVSSGSVAAKIQQSLSSSQMGQTGGGSGCSA